MSNNNENTTKTINFEEFIFIQKHLPIIVHARKFFSGMAVFAHAYIVIWAMTLFTEFVIKSYSFNYTGPISFTVEYAAIIVGMAIATWGLANIISTSPSFYVNSHNQNVKDINMQLYLARAKNDITKKSAACRRWKRKAKTLHNINRQMKSSAKSEKISTTQDAKLEQFTSSGWKS